MIRPHKRRVDEVKAEFALAFRVVYYM